MKKEEKLTIDNLDNYINSFQLKSFDDSDEDEDKSPKKPLQNIGLVTSEKIVTEKHVSDQKQFITSNASILSDNRSPAEIPILQGVNSQIFTNPVQIAQSEQKREAPKISGRANPFGSNLNKPTDYNMDENQKINKPIITPVNRVIKDNIPPIQKQIEEKSKINYHYSVKPPILIQKPETNFEQIIQPPSQLQNFQKQTPELSLKDAYKMVGKALNTKADMFTCEPISNSIEVLDDDGYDANTHVNTLQSPHIVSISSNNKDNFSIKPEKNLSPLKYQSNEFKPKTDNNQISEKSPGMKGFFNESHFLICNKQTSQKFISIKTDYLNSYSIENILQKEYFPINYHNSN